MLNLVSTAKASPHFVPNVLLQAKKEVKILASEKKNFDKGHYDKGPWDKGHWANRK
jgi:hypothetical protein